MCTHRTVTAAASASPGGRLCREQLLRSSLRGTAVGEGRAVPLAPTLHPLRIPHPLQSPHPPLSLQGAHPVTKVPGTLLRPKHPITWPLTPSGQPRTPPTPYPSSRSGWVSRSQQQRPSLSVPARDAQNWATTEPFRSGPGQCPHTWGGSGQRGPGQPRPPATHVPYRGTPDSWSPPIRAPPAPGIPIPGTPRPTGTPDAPPPPVPPAPGTPRRALSEPPLPPRSVTR